MAKTAKIFTTGRSQAVRLPKEFRFSGTEVEISRDAVTGGIILFEKPGLCSDGLLLRRRSG